jgi:uncharacterized protein
MNHYRDDYYDDADGYQGVAAVAPLSERTAFIRRTYMHLLGAVLVFAAMVGVGLGTGAGQQFAMVIAQNWLITILVYFGVGWMARSFAYSSTNVSLQYVGLGLYTTIQAVICIPLCHYAQAVAGPDLVPAAALITLVTFAGLSTIVMVTKSDFSFLRNTLIACSFGAFGLVIASLIFGFSLGIVFVSLMIVIVCGWILYDTSQIMEHYPPNMHVAASLALFSSLVTLFWYIIRLLIILNGRD